MLELRDFFHLPQVEPLIDQLVNGGPGLIVVAGLDPRTEAGGSSGVHFLPSGRSALFNILMDRFLSEHSNLKSTVIAAEKEVVRIPRQFKRRVEVLLAQPPYS